MCAMGTGFRRYDGFWCNTYDGFWCDTYDGSRCNDPAIYSTAFTIASITFFASPNTIIVFG
jgi:hypothetical protein